MAKKTKEKKTSWKMMAWGLAVLATVFIISYYMFNSWGTIEYKNLVFSKEAYGDIIVYHHIYYFKDEGQVYKANIYLRNDPRTNKVPLEGDIAFYKDRPVYISINSSGLSQCEDISFAPQTLSSFLGSNLLTTKAGAPDIAFANVSNVPYVTCDTHPNNIVILMQEGRNTSIVKNNNCHVISISSCEMLPAVEKFIIETLANAKERKKSVGE